MKRTVQMPTLHTRAAFEVSTYNKENRTIDLVWSTGARVFRSSWFEDPWYEELSLDVRHVNMERLNGGAPLLASHNAYSLDAILGSVERAWIVSSTEARATVKLSSRSGIDGIVQDIVDGIIRNVSVGYSTKKLEKVGEEKGVPILRAIDWEPFEISMVGVGADAGAGVRSSEPDILHDCEFLNFEPKMRTKGMGQKPIETSETAAEITETRAAPKPAAPTIDADAIRLAEKTRTAGINQAVRSAGLEDSVAAKLIDDDASVDFAREHVLSVLAQRSKQTGSNPVRITAGEQDDVQSKLRGIEEQINFRVGAIQAPTELSADYRHFTAFDLARECLILKGENVRGLSRHSISQRALMTTSDFPKLLANVANKSLLGAYALAPNTYEFMTSPKGVNDFKALNLYGKGAPPALLEVPEGSEYKRGNMGEVSDTVAIKKFGRVLGFTEEMLINDDLGAFSDVPGEWGRAVRTLEAGLAWGQIINNPQMYDGNALFSLAHGNLAVTPSVMSISSIGDGIAAIENQIAEAAGGEIVEYLGLHAEYLMVPPALKALALQLTGQLNPAAYANVNPYSYLKVVSDPRLIGPAWYLAAANPGAKGIWHLFLNGRKEPQLDERIGFDVDGIEYKVKHYTQFKIQDWRWIYKNAGV